MITYVQKFQYLFGSFSAQSSTDTERREAPELATVGKKKLCVPLHSFLKLGASSSHLAKDIYVIFGVDSGNGLANKTLSKIMNYACNCLTLCQLRLSNAGFRIKDKPSAISGILITAAERALGRLSTLQVL